MKFDKQLYEQRFLQFQKDKRIKKSRQAFKISLFLKKAENSLQIAEFIKNLQPNTDHPKKMFWDYWAITISYYSMLYAAKAAVLSKGYEAEDHDAVQIALGHLLVPNSLEREDLEILEQTHKIFEEEYVHYFEDAKKESHIARYSAIKSYTTRRLEEVFENARELVVKIGHILEDVQ